MENMEIYERGRNVPENARREIRGGRLMGKTDINPMWRLKMLTELFGPCGIGWYYCVTRKWTEKAGEETAAFVDIELYIRADGEWSKPVPGTGGSMLATMGQNGLYVSDECYKMATTDAISVACKQLGIGADVYWNGDASKYGSGTDAAALPEAPGQEAGGEIKELREKLKQELCRTGYGMKSVSNKYKVDRVEDMTKLQLKNCISGLERLPDREAGA